MQFLKAKRINMKSYIVIGLILATLFGGSVIIYNQYSIKRPKIVITNNAPYHMDFYANISFSSEENIIKGPIKVEPGEIKELEWEFEDEPIIYFYYRSSNKDEELMKWVLDIPYPDNASRFLVSPNNKDKIDLTNTKLRLQSAGFYKVEVLREGTFYKHSKINFLIQDNEVLDKFRAKASDEKYSIKNLNNIEDLYHGVMDIFENDAEFVIKNITPFDIYFSVNFQYTKDKHETIGWYHLESGETKTFNRTFYGVHPQVSIYAESANNSSELVRLAYKLNYNEAGKVYYQGIEGQDSIFKPIVEGDTFNLQTILDDYNTDKNSVPVLFSTVFSPKKIDKYEFSETNFEIVDNSFPEIYVDKDKSKWTSKARAINSSLKRQVKYNKSIRGIGDIPYILGLNTYDENGIFDLGVTVSNVIFEKNIIGQDFPFKSGDRILSFAGQEVFTNKDLTILLYDHATSLDGGIGVPIPFTILRSGQLLKGNTLYFFNPNYNGWPSSDWWKSILVGVVDALSLGFDYDLYESFTKSEPWKAWQYLQLKARLRQLNKGYFLVGNLGGAIFSPGRLLLQKPVKRSLGHMGLRGGIAKLGTTMGLEIAEGVIWTYGGSSPLLTQEEFVKLLEDEIKFTAGFGFAVGSFNRIRK